MMISEAEIRRLAGAAAVDPMVVDLDYVLGCFLAGLYGPAAGPKMRAKGGSCLRKCYFEDYRFSEDLDFTAERRLSLDAVGALLEQAARRIQDAWQIDFSVRGINVETVDDEYGAESYSARLYYRGPLRRGGDPRAIRVDITTKELLAFPAVKRPILHPYSDADDLAGVEVSCYDLLETLAEKIRALAGQRQYAIARDVYDVGQLAARHQVDVQLLAEALPGKMRIKGLACDSIDLGHLTSRRDEFEADWHSNLAHLLPQGEMTPFETAWQGAMALLRQVNRRLAAAPEQG